MRCVMKCPVSVRKVNSGMVAAASLALKKACSVRKECQLFIGGQTRYISFANADAPNTVTSPATAMARLLMAPSISPSSMALAVPMAWDAVPSASPLATGSSIWKIPLGIS